MTATEPTSGHANGADSLTQDDDRLRNGEFAADSEPLVPETPLDLQSLCARVHARITAFLEADVEGEVLTKVQIQTREALIVIDRALEAYSFEQLSLSYNGGKDCLVLLILFLHGLYARYLRSGAPGRDVADTKGKKSEQGDYFRPIQSVYIMSKHPFVEVEDFVVMSERVYSLALQRYVMPMKVGFESYLADNPSVKAIFVGTRRTDPHGALLTNFDETDHGWPKFMRIHPVIDWHYVEIWSFIKYLNVPYCQLYDKGYTSLGGTNDTLPNPALRLDASTLVKPVFRPAHELMSDEEERLGREFIEMTSEEVPWEQDQILL